MNGKMRHMDRRKAALEKENKMSIVLSFGRYGGFYIHNGFTKRICLGWMALTFIPKDIDIILAQAGYPSDRN